MKRPTSYQYFNILRKHLDNDLTKIFNGELVYPRQIEIHLPADHKRACNFNCYYCQGKLVDRKVTSGWETKTQPLLNPYFMTFLATTKDCGAHFGIHTNGSHLKWLESNQGWLTELCRLGTDKQDYLSISLDAGFAMSHAKTKGIASGWFPEILKGIRRVAKMKKKLTVRICYLINPWNCSKEEIENIIEFAKEIGVDSLRFSIPYAHYGRDFNLVKDYKKLIERDWGKGVKKILKPLISKGKPHIFYLPPKYQDVEEMDFKQCIYSYYQITLGADGYVYRCSSAASPTFKAHRLGKITDDLGKFNKMILANHNPNWNPCKACWPKGARCNRMALEINKWLKQR